MKRVPAARRLVVLLGAAIAVTAAAQPSSASRSRACGTVGGDGLYLVGCFLIVLGVFNGLRGPSAPEGRRRGPPADGRYPRLRNLLGRYPRRERGRARRRQSNNLAAARGRDRDDRRRRRGGSSHDALAGHGGGAAIGINRSICSTSERASRGLRRRATVPAHASRQLDAQLSELDCARVALHTSRRCAGCRTFDAECRWITASCGRRRWHRCPGP